MWLQHGRRCPLASSLAPGTRKPSLSCFPLRRLIYNMSHRLPLSLGTRICLKSVTSPLCRLGGKLPLVKDRMLDAHPPVQGEVLTSLSILLGPFRRMAVLLCRWLPFSRQLIGLVLLLCFCGRNPMTTVRISP